MFAAIPIVGNEMIESHYKDFKSKTCKLLITIENQHKLNPHQRSLFCQQITKTPNCIKVLNHPLRSPNFGIGALSVS